MTKNPIVTPQDAWRILAESIVPLPAGNVPLERAAGGWLTAPLAPRSAMDGFALRAADVIAPGTRLTVVGEVAAGSDLDPPLPPGACVRIFTGANVPRAADAVVPVEATTSKSFRTNPTDPEVGINTSCRPGDHIFGQGETARQGEILLPAGTRLGPRQLAVAAATGQTDVPIHDRPRVVVLNTGEELLEAGRPAGAHHTRNSNGPFLVAAVAAAGFTEVRRATVPDAADRTAAAFADALAAADAVILTGGISAGRHDYVPGALAAAGVEIAFRGVAIKPGKPQLFGRGPGGNVAEKIEGSAVLPNGEVLIVNDNDGVDSNSGEVQLIKLGKILN